jgi:phosphonate transport system substrate-binding protein
MPGLAAETGDKPLLFGFLPSRSPISLFKHYKPLVDYVSSQLHRNILIETAADYSSFVQRTKDRHYDFVLTAPHFALMATDSGKYYSPITYTKGLMADILVAKNSPLSQVQQLAGKSISIPPESAIISMAGKYFLRQHGLSAARSPHYKVANSHNDSVHAMLSGETDAAIVSVNITRQFSQKHLPIKKLACTERLPGMAILVARDLPKRLRVSFTQAFTQMKSKPAGQAALNKMGYPGYRRTRKNEYEAVRPFIKMYMDSVKNGKD